MRPIGLSVLVCLYAAPLPAQSLSAKLRQLFTFGDCGTLVCLQLAVTDVHGMHFNPDANGAFAAFVGSLTTSAAQTVANVPVASTSSGAIFTITAGGPVKTAVSAGPIFAERYQTMGRGAFFIGANVTVLKLNRFRGDRFDGEGDEDQTLTFNLTHENILDPRLGDPAYERDFIRITPTLNLESVVTSVVATYGLSDKVDIGVAIPVVRSSITGSGSAEIVPYDPAETLHYFSGSISNPVLTATSTPVDGSATGIGDIAARVKVNLYEGRRMGFSVLADARLPTGREEDFLGAGQFSARGVGILSAQYGRFSPHLNAGFLYRSGDEQNSALLATVGFDHLIASPLTVAADLISETLVGENKLTFSPPVTYNAPPGDERSRTSFPFDEKDHVLDASLGMKFTTGGNVTVVANLLLPLLDRGLQPSVAWSFGLQKRF